MLSNLLRNMSLLKKINLKGEENKIEKSEVHGYISGFSIFN